MIKAIATVSFIVLMVGTVIYAQGTIPATIDPRVPVCVTDEDRVHIRALLLAAVDEAWKEQVKHLFNGWLKDPRDQPARASAGIQNSVVVYQRARADALKWNPAPC